MTKKYTQFGDLELELLASEGSYNDSSSRSCESRESEYFQLGKEK